MCKPLACREPGQQIGYKRGRASQRLTLRNWPPASFSSVRARPQSGHLWDEYGHCCGEPLEELPVADPAPLGIDAPVPLPPFHIGSEFAELTLPDEAPLGSELPFGQAPLYGRDPPGWLVGSSHGVFAYRETTPPLLSD